jgi:glycosyltransferase involved in cell wall biosynthesis
MSAQDALTIGVLVCTYRRPADLKRCLDGLRQQSRQPDDVIIVCRDTDQATRDWLDARPENGLPVRVQIVAHPGIVAARNIGHDACRTDILASIDDDVVPHAEWLARMERHFLADPALGGVGGRDHVHDGERFDERLARTVGRLQWFGRAARGPELQGRQYGLSDGGDGRRPVRYTAHRPQDRGP